MKFNEEDLEKLRKYKEGKEYFAKKGIDPDFYDINGNIRNISQEIAEADRKRIEESGYEYFDGHSFRLTPFENLQKYLIEKGVDSSLFEIATIRERLERMEHYFNFYSNVPSPYFEDRDLRIFELDKMKNKTIIHEDGTFEYGELQISRCQDEGKQNCLRIKEHYKRGHSLGFDLYGNYQGEWTSNYYDDVIVDKEGKEVEGVYKEIYELKNLPGEILELSTTTKSRKREEGGKILEEEIQEHHQEDNIKNYNVTYLRKIGEDGEVLEENKTVTTPNDKTKTQESTNIPIQENLLNNRDIAEADKEQALTTTEVSRIKGIINKIKEFFKGKGEK